MAESNDKKAIKAGMGYTTENVLDKGLTFLSIPIFARLLTVEDYGIVNTFTSYVSIISIIINFALHSSIKMQDWTMDSCFWRIIGNDN